MINNTNYKPLPLAKFIFALWILIFLVIANIQAVTVTDHGASGFRALFNTFQIEADFNNDGYMDVLVSGNDGTDDYTEIYINNKDLTFTLLPSVIPQLSYVSADVADFNGDGYIDIVLSGMNGTQKYCKVFKNNGNNTFTVIAAPIENVAYGSVLWADFNNDGILDLYTCGINQAGAYVSRMYKGGNNTFTIVNTSIIPISSGGITKLDYNNDGFVDIALSGYNSSGQIVSYLFKNTGKFTFESVNAGFEKVTNGNIVSADINADGFADVVLTGTNQLGKKVSQLYLNNNGIFIRSSTANLDSLSASNIRVADFNNDGYTDILLTGIDNKGFYQTIIYINNHDNTFIRNNTLFPAFTMASVAIGDFDNDNDIDIILSGKTYSGNATNFYTNNSVTANTAPTVPTLLNASAANDSVTLTWTKSSDSESPTNSLSYNLYLGTTTGQIDILAPGSFLQNGLRKVIQNGNVAQKNSFTIKDLPEGKYYWSVQSLDNGFKGSAFATEQSFTICHDLLVGQDTTVCYGDTISLHAGTNTDQVDWYSKLHGLLASNTLQFPYSVKESDKIIVAMKNKWGCLLHDTIDLKILTLPKINLGKDTAICFHSPITLKAGTGWKKVSWINSAHQLLASDISQYKFLVDVNTSIMVAVTDLKGCRNRDTINILKNNIPVFTPGNDISVCFHDTVKLTFSNSFPDIKWYTVTSPTLLASGINYKYRLFKTDTLVTKIIDINGCKNSDTLIVTMLPLPNISVHKDTSICFGENVTLKANKKINHMTWYSVNLGSPIQDTVSIQLKVKVTDPIRLNVVDGFGCKNSDTIVITKINLPDVNIGADTANCLGNQVLFSANSGWKRVDWYTTGNNLVLANNWFCKYTLSENTKIWAKVVDKNNCVNYDTANITVYALPAFSLGTDTAICTGNKLKLSTPATNVHTLWRSALYGDLLNGPNSLIVNVTQNDVITAEVTDIHHCISVDTIAVMMFRPPVINLVSDTTICYQSPLSLNAGSNWKNTTWRKMTTGQTYSTSPIYNFNSTISDTLILQVVDFNGCKSTDTLSIHVSPLPTFSLGADTSICFGNKLNYSLNSNYAIKWYSAKSGFLTNGSTLSNFSPATHDTLIAVAINALNCQASDTIFINVNALPIVNAGLDTTVCYGGSIALGNKNTASGNGPFVYSWTPLSMVVDSKIANPVVEPRNNSWYFVNVTDGMGCKNTDSIYVQVNPQNIMHLQKELSVCRGQKIALGKSPVISGSKFPYSYAWSPDSILSASNIETPTASPNVSSNYRLIASTWKCPADTAYVSVIVKSIPIPHVSPTITAGTNGHVQLYAEGGLSYRWSPADNLNNSDIQDPIANPMESTLYTVTVIDSFGCSSEASVQVYIRNEVFVPEIFTPNGDGKNDIFKIYGFGFVELSVAIYDRYNNKVYESIDMNEITTHGWDGTFNGKTLESGIYRWIIKGHFANGQAVLVNGENTGIISLIR